MALLLLWSPWAGAQPDGGPERTVHLHGAPTAAGGCVAFSAAQVSLSVDRDWGNLEPDALVQVGEPAQLDGEATWYEVRRDCTSHETPMNIAWRLTFQPLNGIPRDVTGELAPAGSRKPQFTPSAGTYRVRLEAKHPTLNVSTVRELTIVAARENDWVSLGPDGRSPEASGRVNAFARDPSRPGVAYVATARGGIWRSDDDTASWYPITDHRGLPVAMATNDVLVLGSGRILAGTGDSPVDNFPASSRLDFTRNGVYWTDDQGQTWKTGPGKCRNAARPEGTITRLLRDPLDADVVFAASLRNGVFRSGNGGVCWQQLADGSVDDIAIVTGSDGHRELWKATLGGTTSLDQALSVTTNLDTGAPWTSPPAPAIGLPIQPLRYVRIRLASSGTRLYAALAHDAAKDGDNNVLEVWRYDAGGAWTRLALPADNRCDGQCSYNLALAAHPGRPEEVVLGTVTAFRSTDAGENWAEFNTGATIYADQHGLVYDPADPSTIFAANDGGLQKIVVTSGASSSGSAWTFRNRGLATGLFYDMAVAPWSDAATSGTLQDAGVQSRIAGRLWTRIAGADGGRVAYDAVNPGVVYFTIFNNAVDKGLRLFDGVNGTLVSSVGKDGSLEIRQDPYRAATIFRRFSTAFQQSNSVAAPVTSQWGCVEADPFLDSLSALEVAAPGLALVGRQLRGVDLVTLPSDIGNTPDCAQPNPGIEVRTLWDGAPQVSGFQSWDPRGGMILGFTFQAPLRTAPPGPPDSLYVAAARRDAWGVTLLRREHVEIPGHGRPHDKLGGVPIAGDAASAGSLWAAASCGGCEGEDFIVPSVLALDPATPSRVYVGTMAGLFVGTLDQGTWTWSAEPSVPESRITTLRVRNGSWGTGGIVRLSTFGRGLYERVRFTPPHTSISPEVRARLLGTFDSASLHSLTIDLPPGATMRAGLLSAFPTKGGRRIEGIWASPVRVEKGQRFVRIALAAAGTRAPSSDVSDGMALVLEFGKGMKPFGANLPLKAMWHRGDRAGAEILAVAMDEQLQPVPIAVSLTVRERGTVKRIQSGSEYSFLPAVPTTLTAPATVDTASGTAEIAGWIDGAGRFVAGPTVSMSVHGFGKWEVRYKVRSRAHAKK